MGRVSDAKEKLMNAVLELIWTGSYGSTTIDQICEKADVKKGSFYYFFDSKADVAVLALETSCQGKRAEMDSLFSPTIAPLERIQGFCDFVYEKQVKQKKECGSVLGCPLFTLGAEVSTQEQKLRAKIQEILEQHGKYFESAIRDARSAGLIEVADVAVATRMVRAYLEGLLTQARIQNDANVLREMATGIFSMLGVKPAKALAA
jgi:TetR/AcrR family transcriptional repressor of nem operon